MSKPEAAGPAIAEVNNSPSPVSSASSEEEVQRFSVQRFWLDQVDPKHGDLALLTCCFVQGLLDCTVFHNWAVFVGMQTGNTVILCLSTARLPENQPWAWGSTLISILSFFIGAFLTTRLCTMVGPKRRFVLTTNFFFQAILIIVSAILVTASVTVTDADEDAALVLRDSRILIGVAPLAFQSGATIATSRMIGYGNEIPVTVFTSTYAALAGDMKLFHLKGNAPRNRRVAAVVCILGGALSATWIEKKSIGMVAILWFGAGLKIVMSTLVAFLLPRKMEVKALTKTGATA